MPHFFPIHTPANSVKNDLQTLLNTNNRVIIGEDFNAHHREWNCWDINQHGRIIHHFAQSANINLAFPAKPTHCGIGRPSVIDFFILKNIQLPSFIDSLNE
ncbi:hypothetical protein X975_22216, partial [Stegodyphus mimosarum]